MSSQKPILVTGATGFIASHVIKQLLEQDYKVRGTVRSLKNADKNKFLYDLVPEKKDNLELVEADLLKPETWPAACEGIDYILHLASPFSVDIPKDENFFIKPAVEGTLNVLQAGLDKGMKKVVVTSSIASIMYGNEGKTCTPDDWSDPKKCPAYPKSKVLAEKAAWKFWEDNNKSFELATVCPGFVLGKLFTYADGASEKIIKELITGKLPGLPNLCWACVDVHDVAETHIKALFNPNSNGKRYIANSAPIMMPEAGKIAKEEFGKYGYKTTTRKVPNWIVKFGSIFDKRLCILSPELNVVRNFDTSRTTEELGINFRDPKESIKEMGYSLIELGAIPNKLNDKK